MMLRSRRTRPVYRIYTEADYLEAEADPFADWQATTAEPAVESTGLGEAAGEPANSLVRLSTPLGRMGCDRTSRERRLRRLAGAAALTGAVGTVGGLLGSALVGGRSTGHVALSVADRLETSTGTAGTATLPSRKARWLVPRARGAAVGAARAGTWRWGVAGRTRARQAAIANSPGRGRIRRSPIGLGAEPAPSGVSAASAAARPVPVASASQGVPAQPARYSGARGEFGFER